MRLLVACSHCNRQYDASGLEVGRHFRCQCGAVLTVQQPRGHDAAVVCCSRCGAPRNKGALACEFCGADFTLHERDLDTVCPRCLTCVSNHARFCHHCGAPIHPEMVAGDESKLGCPCCGTEHKLRSRALEDVSAMECNRCAGLWLGLESFHRLTDKASLDGQNADQRSAPQKARAEQSESQPATGSRYRPCAVCTQLMVRQNYGRQSGVIVDLCKYHGVWFDADELPRILDWIRTGGLARANEEIARTEAKEETARKQHRAVVGLMNEPVDSSIGSTSIAGLALDALFGLFFRR